MQPNNHTIPSARVNRSAILISMLAAASYFTWWLQPQHIGVPLLFALLFIGEVYHVLMALFFWRTIWPKAEIYTNTKLKRINSTTPVDIFITVCGEPLEIVAETILAAKKMAWKGHQIYLLNDSRVANKANWQEYEQLAAKHQVQCITRTTPGGAKAGNINHALSITNSPYVVIFDADMVPSIDFLKKTMPYFADTKVGFVQTPQYYKNADQNEVAAGAWEQQKLFFGPIMRGKDGDNASFICGTNVVISRKALVEVGGMCEDNIAEDFITSFLIHEKGWRSVYVPEVLARGLAPEDLLSYFKQQLRWARGSLEVLFRFNPAIRRGLSFWQKIHYASSALYYLNGLIVLIDMSMPLIYLFTGLEPVKGTTTRFAFFFLPFMAMTLYILYRSTDYSVTLRAMSFSMSSWTLQLIALWSVLTNKKMGFSVTPKQAQTGNFLHLAYPHLGYIVLTLIASIFAYFRTGFSPSYVTNLAWAFFNIMMFMPFISAAYPWSHLFSKFTKPQHYLTFFRRTQL